MVSKDVIYDQFKDTLFADARKRDLFMFFAGWNQLIYDMCKELLPTGVKIWYMKEKFGSLRVGLVGATNETVRLIIDDFETTSSKTCEICGDPGQIEKGKWLRCYCYTCHNLLYSKFDGEVRKLVEHMKNE